MSNGKDTIIHLIARSIKKHLIQMSQYFPKPDEPFGGNINVNKCQHKCFICSSINF